MVYEFRLSNIYSGGGDSGVIIKYLMVKVWFEEGLGLSCEWACLLPIFCETVIKCYHLNVINGVA